MTTLNRVCRVILRAEVRPSINSCEHTLRTVLHLALLCELNKTSHRASVFFPHSKGGGYKKHCAIKLLTATVLQLCISCCLLIYAILLALTDLSLFLFPTSRSSLPHLSTSLQLLDIFNTL